MKINITAGKCLNDILENKYKDETFVPFNEAMIIGSYTAKLFTLDFIKERATTHNVSIEEYKTNLNDFLQFLDNIYKYDEVVLWFEDEPFCNENKKVVLETLKIYNYRGKIVLNLVIEETGELVRNIII